jgi:hypothetical protein
MVVTIPVSACWANAPELMTVSIEPAKIVFASLIENLSVVEQSKLSRNERVCSPVMVLFGLRGISRLNPSRAPAEVRQRLGIYESTPCPIAQDRGPITRRYCKPRTGYSNAIDLVHEFDSRMA